MNKLLIQKGLWSIQCDKAKVKNFAQHRPMPQA